MDIADWGERKETQKADTVHKRTRRQWKHETWNTAEAQEEKPRVYRLPKHKQKNNLENPNHESQ